MIGQIIQPGYGLKSGLIAMSLILRTLAVLLCLFASAPSQITQPNFAAKAVTFSATPTFNASGAGNVVFTITLTANVTSSTLSNLTAGQLVTFHICQDGTGGWTFAGPANFHGFFTIGATLSTCSDQTCESPDGTNCYAVSPGVVNQ